MTGELKSMDRRSFLRTVGGASTAAAAAVAAPLVPTEARAGEKADEKRRARYRESEHVKAFYRTNRY